MLVKMQLRIINMQNNLEHSQFPAISTKPSLVNKEFTADIRDTIFLWDSTAYPSHNTGFDNDLSCPVTE